MLFVLGVCDSLGFRFRGLGFRGLGFRGLGFRGVGFRFRAYGVTALNLQPQKDVEVSIASPAVRVLSGAHTFKKPQPPQTVDFN